MSSLTAEQMMQQAALDAVHRPIREQLAALRATRGQREVGSLVIPRHLQQPDVVVLASPTADPRQCNVCGRGLQGMERGPSCTRCSLDPSHDGGVERRGTLASVLPTKG